MDQWTIKKSESITTARKNIVKLVKLQSLRNAVKCGKYSIVKSANFAYVCITCGNCYHFRLKNGNDFRA